MKKYLIYTIAILLAGFVFVLFLLNSTYKSMEVYKNNQSALIDSVQFFKTESGKNAATVGRLMLRKRELERYDSNLVKTVKDLRIKLKRVEAIAAVSTEGEYDVQTIIKDVIYRDKLISLKKIDVSDPWFTFKGTIDSNRFEGKFRTWDSLTYVAHRVPRKFWFIRYGCKGISLDVVNQNPHCVIKSAKYVELRK